MKLTLRRFGSLILMFLLFAGCLKGDGKNADVSGKVTLDGTPVDFGTITFIAHEGPTSGAVIQEGNYSTLAETRLRPGKYAVQINWPKKTGKQIPLGSPAPEGTMTDETKEAIPSKYNTETTLTVDIKPGENNLNFELTK